MPTFALPRLHVEVALKQTNIQHAEIKSLVEALLQRCDTIQPGFCFTPAHFPAESPLNNHVRTIQLCNVGHKSGCFLHPTSVDYVFHIYTPTSDGAAMDTGCGDDNTTPTCTHWPLPSDEFLGLWESLIYEDDVKGQLLSFVETAALFADKGVDTNIINWNRVVLLHGPPGTGKTSLCKALAQKLSIRLDRRYRRGQLIEINSHSLFSKWFSESGKLVMKMFEKIREMAEDTDTLVCILIDEVESLTHSRKASMNGLEPSDSVRAVNAVLTQIDQMQRFPNVLILTTSNLSDAIDLAFVDRADIRKFIGLPSIATIYQIYLKCLNELMDKSIIKREHLFQYDMVFNSNFQCNETMKASMELINLAEKSHGLSGRSLKKIPFLAYSLFMDKNHNTVAHFMNAMTSAIQQRGQCGNGGLKKDFEDRLKIKNENGCSDNSP